MKRIEVTVPGKINLWLEVLGKRSDGYHDLSSLMLPVSIHDRVEVALEGEGIRLECDHPEVPEDGRNLAWKAAELYLREAGESVGLSITIDKSIPVGAGMGGGSADAAAVLLALDQAFDKKIPLEKLHGMARSLGADVPFFLYRRPALATGVGERLQPVDGLPPYPLVIIKPPENVSTGWVYGSLELTRGESRIRLDTFLVQPWKLDEVMQNDLESVTLGRYPRLSEIKRWLLDHGALGALMSGSGPTVFGVFPDRASAQSVCGLGVGRWPDCLVKAVDVLV